MPIRGLENFKKQPNQTVYNRVSANILNDVILVVDGYWFLRKYSIPTNAHDIFLFNNKERYLDPVVKLIKMAKDCKAEILWVWDGMSYKKPTSHSDTTDVDYLIDMGYEAYSEGDYFRSNKHWRSLIDPTWMVDDINTLLRSLQVPFMTAPYSATAQMTYFISENIAGYVFGKNDLLIYEGVDKVITDIFFDKQHGFQIELLSRKNICDVLEIDYYEFKSLSFVLGCEFCPTLPEYASNFIFENLVTIIKTVGIKSYFEKTKGLESYIELYENAFILTDYQPVMKENGKVATYYEDNIPCEIEEFFGDLLPNIFYERMFNGLISPDVLNALAFRRFNESDQLLIDLASTTYSICKEKLGIEVVYDGGFIFDKGIEFGDIPNKVEFINIVCPNIKFDPDLDLVSQVVLSKLAEYDALGTSGHHRVLCFSDKTNKIKGANNLDIDKEGLRLLLYGMRVRKELKHCKEVYELFTQTEIMIPFKERFNLVTLLFYNKCEDEGDPLYKACTDYLDKASKFLISNYGISKALKISEHE